MKEEISYQSKDEVRRLYDRIIQMTGRDHGYVSMSNLEYLLETMKDVGERLERKTGNYQEG